VIGTVHKNVVSSKLQEYYFLILIFLGLSYNGMIKRWWMAGSPVKISKPENLRVGSYSFSLSNFVWTMTPFAPQCIGVSTHHHQRKQMKGMSFL
jgi:hypothetical protein